MIPKKCFYFSMILLFLLYIFSPKRKNKITEGFNDVSVKSWQNIAHLEVACSS